jgi:uncharacterized protein
VKLTFDAAKRDETLLHRGLDMGDAWRVFDGPFISIVDDRQDYGEVRNITVGYLGNRMIVLVWTERGGSRRIISMRKANERERTIYSPRLERS